jgi:4-diphosphocytidyl-2-C-methyl-D-erythritol kinase
MVVFPNAKINLGLHVLNSRPDGFHDIETVFYPVGLKDVLEILPAGEDREDFRITGQVVPGDPEDNLCRKAFRMMASDFSIPPVRIHLHKVIPAGSGLGGGSSDGAYTLKALSDLFRLGLPEEKLSGYATRMGSDCTFFLHNRPLFGYGRGDRFEPVAINLSDYRIAVVVPPVNIRTSWAYSVVKPRKPKHFLKEVVTGCPESWRTLLVNDFEKPVYSKYPFIKEIRDRLYKMGSVYASLSGSGSAVYGIFRGSVPQPLDFPGCFSWQSDYLA